MDAGIRKECENDSEAKRALNSCWEEDAREHHEENSNPVVPCDDAEFVAEEHTKNDENPNPEREWSKSKNQERGNPCYDECRNRQNERRMERRVSGAQNGVPDDGVAILMNVAEEGEPRAGLCCDGERADLVAPHGVTSGQESRED